MLHHTIPFPLRVMEKFRAPLSGESEVRWSRKDANTCILFVHGFGGRAVATWGEFPELAVADERFDRADLFFLGYDSRSRSASINVALLYQVVRAVAEDPSGVLEAVRGPTRPENFAYERIILVGHSLGGALVRDVAMYAKSENRRWADSLRLVLFAPAHTGANILLLASVGFGFLRWLGPAKAGVLALFPVLRDLERGSPFLERLVEKAKGIGSHPTTKAQIVVHASDDRIVFHDAFFKDPPTLPYAKCDHISCCKPRSPNFLSPLTDLAGVLS